VRGAHRLGNGRALRDDEGHMRRRVRSRSSLRAVSSGAALKISGTWNRPEQRASKPIAGRTRIRWSASGLRNARSRPRWTLP
jgi:hypothetical protein